MRKAVAALRLARIDTSLLIFLSLFIPLSARTGDPLHGLQQALPLLFIGMCTFIANDLDDVGRDAINHPERPLPSGSIGPQLATILYFISLASALVATKMFVLDRAISIWYYILLTMVISYGYIAEHLPTVKSLYVAATSAIPLLILAFSFPNDRRLPEIALALFFFILGRELCMDILDRPGDPTSSLHAVKPATLARMGFASQVLGIALINIQISSLLDALVACIISLALLFSAVQWFSRKRSRSSIKIMKYSLFLGLYFLSRQ